MGYCLGTAAVTNSPPRLQYTMQGDDFYSLGRAYGVDPNVIIQLQPELKGKAITKKSIQAFVKSRPGWNASGMRLYSAKDNPGTVDSSGRPEGYAIFTSATKLMLPDMPRIDGRSPAGGSPIGPGGGVVPGVNIPPGMLTGGEGDGVLEAGFGGSKAAMVVAGVGVLALGGLLIAESRAKKRPAKRRARRAH